MNETAKNSGWIRKNTNLRDTYYQNANFVAYGDT